MSVYTIDKCERFVSQRAGCGKAARPEFCEGCTTVRGAPTRPNVVNLRTFGNFTDHIHQRRFGI